MTGHTPIAPRPLETVVTVWGETRAVTTPRGRGDQAQHTRAVKAVVQEMYDAKREQEAQRAYDEAIGRTGTRPHPKRGKIVPIRELAYFYRQEIRKRRFEVPRTSGPSPEQVRKGWPKVRYADDPVAAGRNLDGRTEAIVATAVQAETGFSSVCTQITFEEIGETE